MYHGSKGYKLCKHEGIKTILILVLLGLHVGLCAQKNIEVKASLEMNGYWGKGIPCLKVEVKNLTDSTLLIVNSSTYYGEAMFTPKNSYFVADYVLKDGKSGEISGIPLLDPDKNERIIKIDPHQSIKNEFRALKIRGSQGFSGIFPSDFDLSKVAKVRFRLVKVFHAVGTGNGYYPKMDFSSNWVTLKGL